MNDVAKNIAQIRATLPSHVRLVAVSKFHPAEMIREAYDAGQRIFGESRVQELLLKKPVLPDDIEWHFIGHLQTNKVKQIVPFVSMIHSIDTPKLLQEINKAAEHIDRKISCLLQIHIAREESKFGFSFEECREYLRSGAWKDLHSVQLCGVMGMATLTDDREQIKSEFLSLHKLFN